LYLNLSHLSSNSNFIHRFLIIPLLFPSALFFYISFSSPLPLFPLPSFPLLLISLLSFLLPSPAKSVSFLERRENRHLTTDSVTWPIGVKDNYSDFFPCYNSIRCV
jgi:hypothetical protein